MKIFIVFLVFIAVSILGGRPAQMSRCQINFYSTRSNCNLRYKIFDTLRVVRLRDKKVLLNLGRYDYKFPIPLIINGEVGDEYELTYSNFFDQVCNQKILLGKDNREYKFYYDSLQHYDRNLLSKMRTNDTISIVFGSHGCFHEFGREILIKRFKNSFGAYLFYTPSNYEIFWDSLYVLKPRTKQIGYVVLDTNQMKEFTRFENETYHLPSIQHFGPSSETFIVKSRFTDYSRKIGLMEWKGFEDLCTVFYGKEILPIVYKYR